MRFSTIVSVVVAAFPIFAAAAGEGHGEGALEEQGPVAFMWPADRAWVDADDNTGPCGSTAGPSANRTAFPLLNGAIALIIADEATDISLRIAFKSNPTSQADFQDLHTVKSFDEGHQCFSAPELSRDIEAGQLATIQLEYTGMDDGKLDSHYVCADIEFVTTSSFKTAIPCFNVTSEEFVEAGNTDDEKSGAFKLAPAIGFTAALAALFGSLMC